MFLITFSFDNPYHNHVTFHYDIVESVEEWVDEMQEYDDGDRILINVLPISKEQAKKWNGALQSM